MADESKQEVHINKSRKPRLATYCAALRATNDKEQQQLDECKQLGRFYSVMVTHNYVVRWYQQHKQQAIAVGVTWQKLTAEQQQAAQQEAIAECTQRMWQKMLDHAQRLFKRLLKLEQQRTQVQYDLLNVPPYAYLQYARDHDFQSSIFTEAQMEQLRQVVQRCL